MQLDAFCKEAQKISGLRLLREEPLREHGSFRVGGPAAVALFPENEPALIEAVGTLRKYEIPYAVVGRGSNLLFPDSGYNGAVLFTGDMQAISQNGCELTAAAGVSFTALAAAAGRAGLSGLEFAYGIPGSVGGAVYMNAGAYGGEISQVLCSSRYFDCSNGTVGCIEGAAHNFGYRESVYRTHPDWIVLSAVFHLKEGDPSQIREQMDALMTKRREKQPLEYPSAGSTFKRPEGNFAGALIESAGLKGLSVGDAQVSEKHAGFIINRGNATTAQIKALIEMVQQRVYKNSGVRLSREVIYFGED